MIATLAERLRAASRVTLLTGAGVSTASGVPTFRGPGGLWKRHRPESLATPEAFTHDPKLVWEWYLWRRRTIADCRPNPAHDVIAAWSRRYPAFTLITQNVDGLHELAGTASVLRLHGSLWEVSCCNRCAGAPTCWEDRRTELDELPPRCPHCRGLIRPGVVWFGESLDPKVLRRCDAALDCDIFMTIGTSSVVYPAASLAPEAKRRGAFTVEINPEATPASNVLRPKPRSRRSNSTWQPSHQWGQFLVTFPPRDAETALPSAALWHADFDFRSPPDQLAGALVFSFLTALPAHSGGIAILLGSHRVVAQFVARQPREALEPMKRVRKAYMRSDPWLEALG